MQCHMYVTLILDVHSYGYCDYVFMTCLYDFVFHALLCVCILYIFEPPALRRKAATDKLVEKIVKHVS